MAYDHGNPQRNTTTVLAVTVLDLNDNPPVISGGASLTTSVSEVRLYTNSRKKNVWRWNVLSQGRKRYRPCRALSPNLWEIQICWLMVKLTLMKVYLALTGPPPHIPHLLYILLTPFPPSTGSLYYDEASFSGHSAFDHLLMTGSCMTWLRQLEQLVRWKIPSDSVGGIMLCYLQFNNLIQLALLCCPESRLPWLLFA